MESRHSIFFLIFLVAVSSSFGQQQTRRQYLSLSAGFSMPVSGYSSKAIHQPEAGWAATGGQLQVDYIRLLSKRQGVIVSLSGWLHPIAAKNIENNLSHTAIKTPVIYFSPRLYEPAVVTSPGRIYPDWTVKKSSWKLASLQAGAYQELAARKISWYLKGLAGIAYAASPSIEAAGLSGDTARVIISQNKADAWGFCYTLGFGLRKQVSKKLYFIAGAEYKGTAKLVFKDIIAGMANWQTTSTSQSFSQTTVTGSARQSLSAVNLQAGIAWGF